MVIRPRRDGVRGRERGRTSGEMEDAREKRWKIGREKAVKLRTKGKKRSIIKTDTTLAKPGEQCRGFSHS